MTSVLASFLSHRSVFFFMVSFSSSFLGICDWRERGRKEKVSERQEEKINSKLIKLKLDA
jgi:hypothetical protein